MVNPDNLVFKIIEHQSDDYKKAVELRSEILRKPLGLAYSQEELEAENKQIHCAAFEGDRIIACLILVPKDETIMKLRQVCTATDFQGKGIGERLSLFAEEIARNKGFKKMFCHARKTAVPFYQKMNYKVISDEFLEVGIPHFQMEKTF
jgi:predicted GNAT family N-acyltransferase